MLYSFHRFAVWDVRFSPLVSSHFVSASKDALCCIWYSGSLKPHRVLAGHCGDVNCCLIHPNGMYVLTGSLDTTLRVWNIENGEELMILTGHSASVTALSVSPDGRYVASGALDWTVRVWDLKDSTVLRVLSGHSELISSVCFSEESYSLVSTSVDGTLMVWDMTKITNPSAGADGEPYRTVALPGDSVAVSSAFLSCKLSTKASRVLGAQFSARNLLLVASEFGE